MSRIALWRRLSESGGPEPENRWTSGSSDRERLWTFRGDSNPFQTPLDLVWRAVDKSSLLHDSPTPSGDSSTGGRRTQTRARPRETTAYREICTAGGALYDYDDLFLRAPLENSARPPRIASRLFPSRVSLFALTPLIGDSILRHEWTSFDARVRHRNDLDRPERKTLT